MSWTRYCIRSWNPPHGLSDRRVGPSGPRSDIDCSPGGGVEGQSSTPPPGPRLDESLVDHRVGDLEEAGDVRPVDVVAGCPELVGRLAAGPVNGFHDEVQPVVHLLAGPGHAHAVLRHLQPRGRDAARVRGLSGPVENAGVEEDLHAVERRRYVGALGHRVDAAPQEVRRVEAVDLVLGGAREGALCLVGPEPVSYTHLRAHETVLDLVCRLLLE